MLSQVEESIREAIKQSDVPFLGLLGDSLSPEARSVLKIAIMANPTVQGYVRYLGLYPALFSVNLTHHIMKGMGQRGHFELYSHIQKAIGTNTTINNKERDQLWRAFRKAIMTLGFEPSPRLSGPHFMVDEYLRQAGVPLAFADDLAGRMLTFAKRIGIPDEYDPEAIIGWQIALENKLDLPFSITARKAVQLDTQGYYTRKFVKILSLGGNLDVVANTLEKAMVKAFRDQQSGKSFRRAVLPYLVLHDGFLGIFIPGGDEREYEIHVGDTNQLIRAGIEDKLFPINDALPAEISIRELNGNQSTRYMLWVDDRNNRLLFFTDAGRYKGSAQLNQSTPLSLPPGIYTVLSRFSPDGIDAEQISDQPKIFIFTRQVHPAENFSFSNGPAKLEIVGESQPYATWQGSSKTTKEGVEYFFGDLSLDVEFPEEWISLAGNEFILRLTAVGLGEAFDLPFSANESGLSSVDIATEASKHQWKPGFTRVVAEVYRSGEYRSLIRMSAFFWLGLTKVSNELVFECSSFPTNLMEQLNENVLIDDHSLKPKNGLTRTFRIVFKLDERRNQSLTWNVPGIYVEVETLSEKGGTRRTPRAIGIVEAVSVTSPKQIVISANDDGELSLGDWTQRVAFSRIQSKRLPASFLASRITPQRTRLIYKNERTSNEIELLQLVQPHHVTGISGKASAGQLIIRIDLPTELGALTIRAQDVISGKDIEVLVEANSPQQSVHRLGRVQIMCLPETSGGFSVSVNFSLDIWPAGAWVFQFKGMVNGIWGNLENARQDHFAWGFLCNEQGSSQPTKEFLDGLSDLTDKESKEMLIRVQNAIQPCYSLESWNSMKWLSDAWSYLLEKMRGNESDFIDVLLPLAASQPPDDSSPSWMLQQTVGSRNPKIFCLPGKDYRKVPTKHNPLVQAGKILCQFKEQYPAVFPELINPVAAAGFVNFAEVSRGGMPRGYSVSNYLAAMRETGSVVRDLYRLEDLDFTPVPGDYLGALHYKHSIRKLEESYERSRSGNEIRLGQVIRLCTYVRRIMPTLTEKDSSRLAGTSPHIDPWPFQDSDGVDDYLAQRNQNIYDIALTLSWLAYHCRLEAKSEEKSNGFLDEYLGKLEASGAPVENSLAYLLQVGDAVFAYYLVLWELVVTAERIAG